jgi:hypothetical protein
MMRISTLCVTPQLGGSGAGGDGLSLQRLAERIWRGLHFVQDDGILGFAKTVE